MKIKKELQKAWRKIKLYTFVTAGVVIFCLLFYFIASVLLGAFMAAFAVGVITVLLFIAFKKF